MSFAIIILGVVLALATFRDYGVTWDEDAHNWYGNFVLDYYLSFFTERNALYWRDLYNYGGAFDSAAAALNRVSSLGTYETRHLFNALVGILGFVGCYKLGHALGGARAGFFSALFLLLIPNYYGQMFNNPKDIPFAVGVIWATYYMVRMVPFLSRPPFGLLARLGAAIGMTMGVRVGGLLLLFYLSLLLAFDGGWRSIVAGRPLLLVEIGWISLLRILSPVLLFAYAVMLLFWPWAQTDPIENPLRALLFFSHQDFPFSTLFAGRLVPASNLPWTYLPTHIILQLPELVLVLLICAPLPALAALVQARKQVTRERVLAHLMLAIGIVFPVAFAIAIKAVLFDGMRHFIFLLPLAAVAAALVASYFATQLAEHRYRKPVYAVLLLYGVAHVSIIIMLHPDQYVYYNSFVGGVSGAEQKFKLDYWANSYAEAVQGLEDYLYKAYGFDFEEHEFPIAVCGPPISADYYFPANFRFTRQLGRADFFIAFTKDNCNRSLAGWPVYKVERMGALLSVVLDRRDVLPKTRTGEPAAVLSKVPLPP